MFLRILRKLLIGIGVLWGAVTLTFLAINTAGGDPALTILGGDDAAVTKAALDQVRIDYGLDKPILEQYFNYLGKIARGDFGESYRLHIPVTKAIGQQIGSTLQLAIPASIVTFVLAVVIALATARRAPWIRSLASNTELVLSSMPSFLIGIALLLLFSFAIPIFPASGSESWKSLILPSFAIALPVSSVLAQVLRNDIEEILELPFILTSRTRGMGDASVRILHALRHALIPLITLSGFIIAGLLGGTVVVETLFSRPGVGRLLSDSVSVKDVPIVLGVTTLSALVYVTVNVLVDISYAIVDPRIRISR